MCPASMLAKRRSERLIGREMKEILDHDDEEKQPARHARGHEESEEMGAVLDESVDDDRAYDENREREGDDDVARHREKARNHAEHVRCEYEHEEREDEGERTSSLRAGRVAERARNEIVQNFGDRLGASRNDGTLARGEGQARPRSPRRLRS